ncbi:MAG: chemotaxis protein CheA [Nitrospirae bacterium]|nr:chemotaxis protein CheA [Nitrospirota bacterium]
MDLEQGKKIYIEESRELLDDMDQALLALESDPSDSELINRIFRTAHTIKGSGGMFGFDEIVSFTHVLETLLDKVRAGSIAIATDPKGDSPLLALLFRARDNLALMVEGLSTGASAPAAETEEIRGLLQSYGGSGKAAGPAPSAAPAAPGGGPADPDHYSHVSVRFGRDTFRHGMDPAAFLHPLAKLGEINTVICVLDSLPALNDESFDPEDCYLGFEINLCTAASKTEIEDVFEFVRDESRIAILPPESSVGEFVDLIKSHPGEDMELGAYLVQCRAVTSTEIMRALEEQKKGGGLIGEILVKQGSVQKEVVEAALEKQKTVRAQKAQEASSIRVDAGKLESLIDLVGELVIAGANVLQLSHKAGSGALVESASGVYRLVEELREIALSVRMVPIGETFTRFQRVVRDISKEVGKEIALVINGGEAELDKTVVEKINDPLVHLVRNSIDHGIETPEVREKRGKPAKGTIRLNAYHDAGTIVIEVSDDGGGLNRERILKKAVERGLISAGQNLSDREVYRLIFEAGFSTAEKVTDLSGRGVGMDVVRRNIEALRGSVDVSSEEGKGTKVTIRLPLTLAIIDGFQVGVGGNSYVVPLDMVVECVELTEADRRSSNGRDFINLRGEVLPFIALRHLFGGNGEKDARENIVVIQYAGMKAGFVVDGLMGEVQTVIKPLGKVFQGLKGVSGATILGSGRHPLAILPPLSPFEGERIKVRGCGLGIGRIEKGRKH